MIVTFQGASDDLVEIDGAPGADEFNVYENKNGYVGTWLVEEQDKGTDRYTGLRFYVDAYYRGTWSFAIRQVADGDTFGNIIAITTTNETINEYTTLLWIDTNDVDVSIRKVSGTE